MKINKKKIIIVLSLFLFALFLGTLITLDKNDLPSKLSNLKGSTYVTRKATFVSTGLDYIETKELTCKDYGSGCTIKLPRFNKKGYYSTWWSIVSLPSQNLKGKEWKWNYFYPIGHSYLLKSDQTFYPNFNHFHYDLDKNYAKFRSFNISESIVIGNTLFEFEEGIPKSAINKFINFAKIAYSIVPWEYTPTKAFVMTPSTYSEYSIAYGLTHNVYADSSRIYESYITIDLQYDSSTNSISENAFLHELGHTWDYYYKSLTGKKLCEQSDVVSLFNQMKNRGVINSSYSDADANSSNVEWFAGMVTNYYWHVLGKDDSKQYYALTGAMTQSEKNTWKTIMEKYGNQSIVRYPSWNMQTYFIDYNGNGGKYYCPADNKYYGVYEGDNPSKYCSSYGANLSKVFKYGDSYTGTSSIVSNNKYNNENFFVREGYRFIGWTTNSDGTNDNYGWSPGYPGENTKKWIWNNGEYGINNNRIILYAMWEKDDIKVIDDSYMQLTGGKLYIKIPKGTKSISKNGLLNNLTGTDGWNVYNKSDSIITSGTTLITTGSYIKNGNTEYKIVIYGDIDKDGLITIKDLYQSYLLYKNKASLDNYQILAADYNRDGTKDIKDLYEIYKKMKDKD